MKKENKKKRNRIEMKNARDVRSLCVCILHAAASTYKRWCDSMMKKKTAAQRFQNEFRRVWGVLWNYRIITHLGLISTLADIREMQMQRSNFCRSRFSRLFSFSISSCNIFFFMVAWERSRALAPSLSISLEYLLNVIVIDVKKQIFACAIHFR